MVVFKRGMVLLVDLNPTKGSETEKIRPCVIVTNDTYNAKVPVIQVVPITAWNEKKKQITTNIEIDASIENGLSKKSIVDCLQTRPIDHRERFVKVLGQLSAIDMAKVDIALKAVFNL